MSNLYDAINHVMNRFNFAQVHRVMTFLDWKWACSPSVPTVEMLKAEAYRQLSMCIDEYEKRGRPASGMLISSGGFEATIHCYESGKPWLQLNFCVDHVSSNGEY